MTQPVYLSKSAFAAHIGRAPSYITWLKNNNRLVLSPDGKQVDVSATESLIASTADPSKAAVAARHQKERIQKNILDQLSPSIDSPLPINELSSIVSMPGQPDFQKARAHREYYLAQLAEAEFHKVQGNLVVREAVNKAAYTAGRTVRDLMFGLSPQLAPELAGMSDPWQIEKHLTAAFRRVFDDAARMATADLDHAMTEK
ncbi:terminase small subunit [Pseudomonas viridiflava]|uniref:terminase small subunit n=1 Tax=Pseudomonas viridiflava TaxID=33069 RepID=UPI000F02F0D5|nr:terminase small subunit [Pseudomonas viridiflava]